MKENKNLAFGEIALRSNVGPLSLKDSSSLRTGSGEVSREGTTILKTNLKNNSKLRPLNRIIGDVGKMQYFPA